MAIVQGIVPKVALQGKPTRFTIAPDAPSSFEEGASYSISLMPVEHRRDPVNPGSIVATSVANKGILTFEGTLYSEQEYIVEVRRATDSAGSEVFRYHIYSVKESLYIRRPYKGDMHLHTHHSDGQGTPGRVAALCRKIGYSYMAITDHGKYWPSIEARESFKDVDTDLVICPGEEVHPPKNPVHLINFGGSFSINEQFQSEAYIPGVQKIMNKLGVLPAGVDPYQFASTVWCFDKIREANGLGIFAHPFWRVGDGYTPDAALTDYLFDEEPFDAFEVVGGFHKYELDSNTLQVAYYNEQRAKGRRIAIVGSSDAHGCENGTLFGWYFTICFSPSLHQDDVIYNIKEHYSVAVEAVDSEHPRVYGPFRLVKFALFLMREVFPGYDRLCREEGDALLEHLEGDPTAKEKLKTYKGRTQRYLDTMFGAEVQG